MEDAKQKLDEGAFLFVKGPPILTIQDSGLNAGVRAVFVTLCTEEGTSISIKELAENVAEYNAETCVLIGGDEPFLQNFVPFALLLNRKYVIKTQVETNGQYWIEGAHCVDIVVSPKTPSIHPRINDYALAFKYTIDTRDQRIGFVPIVDGVSLSAPSSDCMAVYLIPKECVNPYQNKFNNELVVDLALKYECIACCNLRKVLGAREP